MSRGPIPDRAPDRPTVPEAAALARRIRGDGGTTCCAHCMIDDPNYDDSSAAFCLAEAREKKHAECERLASMLVQMTTSQRRRVSRGAWR